MLECKNITWKYDENAALSDLSCAFKEQAFTMILGPNGSGKSTLIKLLSGTQKPQKGEVLLDNVSLRRLQPRFLAKKIAYVAQNSKIEYAFSVRDIVLMGRYAYVPLLGTESAQDIAFAEEAMVQTGVAHLARRSVLEISGGELQRVLLARALAQNCSYLLLDEPITGLDISHQLEFLNLVRTLCSQRAITAVCVLHDLEMAYNFGDFVLLLNNGKAESYGTAKEVLSSANIEKVYGTRADIFTRNEKTHIAFERV